MAELNRKVVTVAGLISAAVLLFALPENVYSSIEGWRKFLSNPDVTQAFVIFGIIFLKIIFTAVLTWSMACVLFWIFEYLKQRMQDNKKEPDISLTEAIEYILQESIDGTAYPGNEWKYAADSLIEYAKEGQISFWHEEEGRKTLMEKGELSNFQILQIKDKRGYRHYVITDADKRFHAVVYTQNSKLRKLYTSKY